ncbi:hypothetical protein IJ21_11840 [Paenibacillus sp. 32O-W]|nr:hypothetical protein IJ21_11840 [Paenibacillus sp. 32O-W]
MPVRASFVPRSFGPRSFVPAQRSSALVRSVLRSVRARSFRRNVLPRSFVPCYVRSGIRFGPALSHNVRSVLRWFRHYVRFALRSVRRSYPSMMRMTLTPLTPGKKCKSASFLPSLSLFQRNCCENTSFGEAKRGIRAKSRKIPAQSQEFSVFRPIPGKLMHFCNFLTPSAAASPDPRIIGCPPRTGNCHSDHRIVITARRQFDPQSFRLWTMPAPNLRSDRAGPRYRSTAGSDPG